MKPYPALLAELLSEELSSLRQQMVLTQEAMAERLRISSRAYSDLPSLITSFDDISDNFI